MTSSALFFLLGVQTSWNNALKVVFSFNCRMPWVDRKRWWELRANLLMPVILGVSSVGILKKSKQGSICPSEILLYLVE